MFPERLLKLVATSWTGERSNPLSGGRHVRIRIRNRRNGVFIRQPQRDAITHQAEAIEDRVASLYSRIASPLVREDEETPGGGVMENIAGFDVFLSHSSDDKPAVEALAADCWPSVEVDGALRVSWCRIKQRSRR